MLLIDPISLPFLSFSRIKPIKMSAPGYGTISEEDPEDASSSSNKQFLSWTKELQLQTIVGTAKPWEHMIRPSRLTPPFSFFNSIQRIKTNARVYRTNYEVVILLIVLLTLLWHPICVIIFCALMFSWVVLYSVRDNPLRAFGYEVDKRLAGTLLSMVTVGLIFLGDVTENILVGVCVGVLVVFVHGVMRETEEEDEEEAGAGIRLRHAASSSFVSA